MNVTSSKDAKKRYLTYSIVVRPANAANGTQEETVTKKMAKFIDGGPKDFLEWVYHFKQLAMAKNWNAEDKFLNTALLLESDLHDAFDDAAITDDDVRMEEEFWRILYSASKVVLPVDCSEKLQEELWEIKKVRSESLAKCSKRFRALARMEKTLAKLSENPAMCEDALFRLFKRGFLTNGRTKMMPVGKYIQLLLLCCLNISKRYCMLPEIVVRIPFVLWSTGKNSSMLSLTTDYRPSHAKPYSIARNEEDATRCEIKRLIDLDVMEHIADRRLLLPRFSCRSQVEH